MPNETLPALTAFNTAETRDTRRTAVSAVLIMTLGAALALVAGLTLDGVAAKGATYALVIGSIAVALFPRPPRAEVRQADRALGDALTTALTARGFQVEGQPAGRLYLSETGWVRATDPDGNHVIVRARQRAKTVDFEFTPTERLTMVNA